MSEQWKPIQGYEGLYDISDHGRVRSYRKQVGGRPFVFTNPQLFFLIPLKHNSGYLQVGLRKGGKHRQNYYIHRLVLEAFVGRCPPGHECCHKDSNKRHNYIGNLCWDTHRNNQTCYGPSPILGMSGKDNPAAVLNEDTIRAIRTRARTTTLTHREIATEFGVSRRNVSKIIQRVRWAHIA